MEETRGDTETLTESGSKRASANRRKLDARFVEGLKPPADGKAEIIWDTDQRGFGLRIQPSGRKTWLAVYQRDGRSRWLTLGTYPPLSLKDARDLAKDKLADVQKGVDPATVKREAREQPTFRELRVRYFDDYARDRKRSWRQDEWMLSKYVPQAWNSRRLGSFSRDEMTRFHSNLGREYGQSTANHVLRLLRAMFNLAHDWEILKGENPAAGIKLFREKRRERFLTPDEIKALNRALAEEPDRYWRAFFALALLTGCRRSELLGAQWRQVDLDAKTLTLPVTKADRPHLLPLSDAAIALVSSLPSRAAGGFIFPSHGKQGHLVEPKTAWRRICKRASVTGCRIHDLRHSLASILIQRGYGIALVGKILNHSQLSTTERYAHLDLESERRAIDDAASLISGNVVN